MTTGPTPAELHDARRHDLRIARVELRNAGARLGAIVNSQSRTLRYNVKAYDEAAASLDAAARAFVRAELEVARAERNAREAAAVLEAARAEAAEAEARRAARPHLCVIDGGER